VTCPECRTEGAFRVILVSGRGYTRRCQKCDARQRFPLPPIARQLIYLDQFAISDMLKAVNPELRANPKGRADPFWIELSETLRRLLRLQLIACPQSEFHEQESAVCSFRDELKSLYRQLSAGIGFRDPAWILRVQIHDQVTKWVHGEDVADVEINRRRVLTGDPTDWTDSVLVYFNLTDPRGHIEDLRQYRATGHLALQQLFARWRAERKAFDDVFLDMIRDWATGTLSEYWDHLEWKQQVLNAALPPTQDLLFPPPAVEVVRTIKDALEHAGVAQEELLPKTGVYLDSDAIRWLPVYRLSASLWATLAVQARQRARPPNRGMLNDIHMISTLLPYCDAMFVDSECHGLIGNLPKAYRPRDACQVFSATNKEAFLKYLRKIESTAPEAHLEKVREVYGSL
jgi:hypothetical protein